MSITYTVIILCALGHIGVKALLHVYLDEVTVGPIDPEYFDPEYTDMFVTDENSISSNWTIVKKFPPETTATLKILGLSMGKYVLPTGLNYVVPFCEMVRDPAIMGSFTASLGFSLDDCPPKPGTYYDAGYKVVMESLPDYFPENKYLLILEIIVGGNPIFSDNLYFETQNS